MAGNVIPLTNGTVTGSGTISLDGGYLFGGVDRNTDGTNAGAVIVRDQLTGNVILDTSSITGKTIIAPFLVPSGIITYAVTGTGADAMLYKWNE